MTRKLTIPFFILLLGILCSCGNDVERARVAYDEGVKLMFNYGKFAEAEEQFTQAIKYDKNNYEAYFYRGCTKFNRKLYQEALIDFEKALEIKPGYHDAEFAIGRIYFIQGDRDMACYYYKAAQAHGRPNLEDEVKGCPE